MKYNKPLSPIRAVHVPPKGPFLEMRQGGSEGRIEMRMVLSPRLRHRLPSIDYLALQTLKNQALA